MSTWVDETFVLEGKREDIERFSMDVNAVTEAVLKKAQMTEDEFLIRGLDPELWDLYSEEMNKVYPTEIYSIGDEPDQNNEAFVDNLDLELEMLDLFSGEIVKGNKFNKKTGVFSCNNILTVSRLNDQLYYTVLECSCVGMPCSYRELFVKYYPECRFYYYDVIENGGCETNDVNGRYFRVRNNGPIYFRKNYYNGYYVTEEEYLSIMRNLFHNHSLKLDDVISSLHNDEEYASLFPLRIYNEDRAIVDGSMEDLPAEGITCPVLDRWKIEAEENGLKEYMSSIENSDYIDYERYPEYDCDKFVFGGTADGRPSGKIYGIKSRACIDGVIEIPEGITEIADDAIDLWNEEYKDLKTILLPASFKGEPAARWIMLNSSEKVKVTYI